MNVELGIRASIAAFIAALVFHLIPTFIEMQLESSFGPLFVYGMMGDALGCGFIFALRKRVGLGLYLALVGIKIALQQTGTVDSTTLAWFSDLVPASLLSIAASTLATGAGFRSGHLFPPSTAMEQELK
jgi:hypothetical protein